MAKVKYTEEQIKELENNKYVKRCTNKNITFTKEFKLELIKQTKNWIFYKDIFKNFWFPEYVINSEIPRNSLNRWKRNISRKWLIEENKWRKKKEIIDVLKMTKDEYIEYLEAKLAIIEELKKIDRWEYP